MVIEYANYLAEREHEVVLWYNNFKTVFNPHPKLKLIKIPIPSKLGTIIYATLKRFNSDVIIVDIVALASLLSLRNRSRLIYFAQDYDESYYKNKLKKLLIRTLYFFCLRLMKVKVIAVAEWLSQILKEKYDADVATVVNGIDLNTFYPDPDEELIRIKGDKKAVLLLSRNEYRKGFDIAIKVINKLSDAYRDKIEVWTCGEQVKQEIFKSKVINFGWVREDKLRQIISSADILLYPSRHEGYPLFPLETMACGCLVVTTKAVSYVADGENALVSEIEDTDYLKEKLMNILNDELLREKLKKSGFDTVSKYDIKESQRKFEKAIMDIFPFKHNSSPDKLLKISSK